MQCPKCDATSGDDWSQWIGDYPMPMSPYYKPPADDTPEGMARVGEYGDYFIDYE